MIPILTITLNPAVDVSANVPKVTAGDKLRCVDPSLDPGGGGVNVARAIHILGGEAVPFVAIAGAMGRLLVDLMEGEGLRPVLFQIPGLTRQSFAVTETETNRQYRFTLPGPSWSEASISKALSGIARATPEGAFVVLSGSQPASVPVDLPDRLATALRPKGAKLVIDTSGPALTRAAETGPFHILRMDKAEAEGLAGQEFTTPAELGQFACTLVKRGAAKIVIMALGADGNTVATEAGAFHCAAPKTPVVSTVGAGDSFVGALVMALARGDALRDAARLATAAAASAVSTPATRLCDRAVTEALFLQTSSVDLPG